MRNRNGPGRERLTGGAGAGLVLGALLLLAAQAACDSGPAVVVEGPEGVRAAFRVEVADTPEKRRRGLMYRRDLATDQGMLFVFPEERVQSFWMKNTPLSLDILFLDRRRRVVGIIRDTVPFSTRSVSVATPSVYALEVRAGLSRRHGIAVGDVVRFQRIP